MPPHAPATSPAVFNDRKHIGDQLDHLSRRLTEAIPKALDLPMSSGWNNELITLRNQLVDVLDRAEALATKGAER